MKIVSIVGARPQFVKLAPIDNQLREEGHEHVIVHTGQHYDPGMSDVFFNGLGIQPPDRHLAVGSDTHGRQTGRMLTGLDEVLESLTPDWVMVYGDTNSTIAGALSATKMHIRVAHLEAGLRSFNRRMPEELNRVATDHLSDLCLAPTSTAMTHLATEGLSERSVMVGDVMTDVLFATRDKLQRSSVPAIARSDGDYLFVTLHRAENTEPPGRLAAILRAIHDLPNQVMLSAHPRLTHTAQQLGLNLAAPNTTIVEPLPYESLVNAVTNASGVITDSGGLQKESFLLGVPCTTVRDETEWVETLQGGWNVLVKNLDMLGECVNRPTPAPITSEPFGDGKSAAKVVRELQQRVS